MIGIKFIECHWCDKTFKEGEGHRCWCAKCIKSWPMCEECYQLFKELGDVVDRVPKRDEVAPWIDEKLI